MPVPNVTSARDLIEIDYGANVITRPVESDATVGISVTKLGANANTRTAVYVCNLGSNPIVIGFGNGVTATTGIQVPAGGFFSMTWKTDGELVNSDLWAISAVAGNAVHVVESVLSGS